MQNLIDKYGLRIKLGPCFVHSTNRFSIDKRFKEEPHFFDIIEKPKGSYDEMFPVPDEILGSLHLFLLSYERDIDTRSFLRDVVADPTLRLVGVHGMILLAETQFGQIPYYATIVSPAYVIDELGHGPETKKLAQMPYFNMRERGMISVNYSTSRATTFFQPGLEFILLGQVVPK